MQTELRPAHLDDWLDTLPYANAEKCLETMEAALAETNKSAIKPSVRIELLALYWPRYRYLLDTKIRNSGVGATRNAAQRQQLIGMLKRVALEIGFGARLGTRDELTHKSLFRTTRPPTKGTMLAVTAYAHGLALGFQEYAPTPGNVWRELHELYEHAEALEFLDEQIADPDDSDGAKTTIRLAYARICACALVDPHHMEAEDIWQVYELARQWSSELAIEPFVPAEYAEGLFVIDLHLPAGPTSYAKLQLDRTTPHLRLMNTSSLAAHCLAEVERIGVRTATSQIDRSSGRLRLLMFLARAWGEIQKRQLPREPRSASVPVVIGINAVHAQLAGPDGASTAPVMDSWQLLNEGPEGYMLYMAERPQQGIRVGDLVGLRSGTGGAQWVVGMVRWLMIERGRVYRIGIQQLSRAARAIRIRALTGPDIVMQPRTAFVLESLKAGEPHTILTSPGLYSPQLDLELTAGAQQQTVTTAEIVDRTVAFDRFTYQT